MTEYKKLINPFLSFSLFVSFSAAAQAAPILDLSAPTLWQTADGSARITLTRCEEATPCGVISWVKPDGPSTTDRNNPDPMLRDRSLVGIPMLWGFKMKGSSWANGKIYNPKDGKTYTSHMRLSDEGILLVKGCVGPFCKTQKWTLVETKK